MAFSDLSINLRLITSGFTNAMNNVRRQAQRLSSQLASVSTEGSANELIAGYTSLNDRLHNVGLSLRDIARIAAGIAISQTFYTITRNIREATRSLWEFNESLDYAQVTYSALFGDAQLSSSFIDTLKQFSVDTIFEYTDIENMARKLSAYGIEYQNLMYIIEGLTNIGTISGDSAALERLAVAIGQINAKGKLTAEEMRQLANAYVPIYDVLSEKLGLTEEQLKSVGDLGISSADAIDAIIEYANEQFGATAEAAVQTITGLNNKIVDTLKVMGADIMRPVTTFYKSLASFISSSLAEIHQIYKESGLGGVFEHLVPSEVWQRRIRNLLAAIKNTFSTIIASFTTLWPVISNTFGGLIDAFTVFLGVLNSVASGVVGVIQAISANTPALNILTKALVTAAAAWMLFKIQALGAAIVTGVRVAIVGVANAVLFLVRALTVHPIIVTLTLLGAVLIGVASNANNTNSAINRLIDTFNSISVGGDTADDILQAGGAMEEATDQSDKFWDSMKEGAEDAEDSIEGAGNKAKKASKSLLSFDEVFRLQDNDTSGSSGLGSGVLDGIGDLAGALGGLGSALIPEIPDLSIFANDFVSTLYNELWDSIKTIASGGATGALIGGLVGFAIGGFVTKSMSGALTGAKWGAKIGAVAGAAFAGFWTDTYKEMEASLLKVAVGGASGALIGGLIGMVIGAFATKTVDGALTGAKYGSTIGSLLGSGIGAFWAGATEEMNSAIEGLVVGTGAGALAGALAGFIIGAFTTKTLAGATAGAKLGAKIGTGVGAVFGAIFGSLEEDLQKRIAAIGAGASYGALAGGLVGLLLGALATRTMAGAKAGAQLGAKIGTVVGGTMASTLEPAEEGIASALENMFSSASAAGVGSLIGGLVGMIIGAIVGAFAGGIGAIPGAKAGAMLGSAIGGLGGMVYQALKDSSTFESVEAYFNELADAPMSGLIKLGASVSTFMNTLIITLNQTMVGMVTGITTWLNDTGTSIIKFLIELGVSVSNRVTTFTSGLLTGIIKWFADLNSNAATFFGDLISNVVDFFADILSNVLGWIAELDVPVVSWLADKAKALSDWVAEVLKTIISFFTGGYAIVAQSLADAGTHIVEWLAGVVTSFNTWSGDVLSSIATFFSDLFHDFTVGFRDVYTSVTTFCADALKAIGNWFVDITTDTDNWFAGFKKDVKAWWENTFKVGSWKTAWSHVVTWFEKFWTDVSTWFTNRKTITKTKWSSLFDITGWKSGWDMVSKWFTDLFSRIGEWFTSLGKSISTWWSSLWDGKEAKVSTDTTNSTFSLGGHATGGIFNREHIARFAEGNKAEAVIPLENASAMQPFVTAISDGILQGLLPAMASSGNGSTNNLPPMYVGTLIADERGLQQLYKKFELYEAKELARKGML